MAEAAIARIERLNPQFNCVIFKRHEKALAQARDRSRIQSGMFRGVPFLMKDLLQTIAGEPFSWGWKPFKDAGLIADSASYAAAKFGAAGLVTLAQTTVPERGATRRLRWTPGYMPGDPWMARLAAQIERAAPWSGRRPRVHA